MDFQDDLTLNVFTGPTTYLNDYRRYHGVHRIVPDYSRAKFEDPIRKPPPSSMIDLETYIPLRKKIPMDLMIHPNEVTRSNPHREFGDTVRLWYNDQKSFFFWNSIKGSCNYSEKTKSCLDIGNFKPFLYTPAVATSLICSIEFISGFTRRREEGWNYKDSTKSFLFTTSEHGRYIWSRDE